MALMVPARAPLAAGNCFNTDWPSDHSLLRPDPELVRGKLANGLRYIIKKNREPEKRVAVFLDVQAGSLNESERQRGIAHFLEHMVFNGSTHFPPGSLVDYFQSIGMGFGNDVNGHTGFNETVYNLFLPNGSKEELEKGFQVLADYGQGAFLLQSEIEKERGVILAEKRTRDSAGYRNYVAHSAYAFRGTKIAERMPIGIDATLMAADHKILLSFYRAWYRPEKLIVVVVGDVDTGVVEKLVAKIFSGLSSPPDRPECPDFGRLVNHGLDTFYHYEPELGKTNVSIETMWDGEVRDDSLELEKNEYIRYLASLIMGYRLQRIEEEKQPFSATAYYSGDVVGRIKYGMLRGETDADHWRETLATLDRILRQAVVHGFTAEEVERGKVDIISELEANVLTANTKDSREIARLIIRNLNSNRVYQNPRQEMDIYRPIIEKITVADVNRVFRSTWNHDNRLLSVSGNVRLKEPVAGEIKKEYKKAEMVDVAPPHGKSAQPFPYLIVDGDTDPSPVKIVLPEISGEKLLFANGLVVNLKKTLFSENSLQMTSSFGKGKLTEPRAGISFLAQLVVNGSGSGKLSQSEIDEISGGSSVKMHFSIGQDDFRWQGSALKKDFLLLVQLLHTRLVDPGFRRAVFDNVKSDAERMYRELGKQVEGAFSLQIRPFLAGFNHHFGLAPWPEVARLQYSQVKSWIDTAKDLDGLEISLVGDFDRDKVVKILGHYFGNIPLARREDEKYKGRQERVAEDGAAQSTIVFPAGQHRQVVVDTSMDKSLLVLAWPTDDFWDISRTRRLHILASIFEDRLRKTIREKMGATYSPVCASWSSRAYKGYGYIFVQLTVQPGMEKKIIEETERISFLLQREGVSQEELSRAQKPIVTMLKDQVKNNLYWLNSVLVQSSRHPQQLQWPVTIISDYATIGVESIDRLAKQYLKAEKMAVISVIPGPENK